MGGGVVSAGPSAGIGDQTGHLRRVCVQMCRSTLAVFNQCWLKVWAHPQEKF